MDLYSIYHYVVFQKLHPKLSKSPQHSVKDICLQCFHFNVTTEERSFLIFVVCPAATCIKNHSGKFRCFPSTERLLLTFKQLHVTAGICHFTNISQGSIP